MGEVLGSYRLIEELSTGGMGTVYRGQHELLGRSAAIKLLRPELCENDVLVQRFFNEAKAATAIRHPGIVEVYDFGYTDDGRAYFVMELLEGEPLGARIARRGRLTEIEAATIGRGITASLRAAHAKGIVHRDLKPDNVFLVPDGDGTGDRVKVLDFGVAKLSDPSPTNVRHTQTGVLMGTPLYMAPEQARAAGTIDHRADLYSLGCILYELLVGEPPFVADGAGEIIAMQLFNEPARPSTRVSVSPQMDALVMRLLEKEPHDRYQQAADVHQALTELVPGAGSSLPGISSSRLAPTPMPTAQRSLKLGLIDEAPPPPPKRSALPIVAGVITILLAAGAGILVLTRGSDDETAKPTTPARAPAQPATSPSPTTATATTPATATITAPPATATATANTGATTATANTAVLPPAAATTTPTPGATGPAATQAAVDPVTPAAAGTPRTVKRGDRGRKVEKPNGAAGPVVKPSELPAKDGGADGPTTRPGMRTSEGAPIEPDLGAP
ncbi:MAG: serine/threonine protein kinase [Myxococcales bacterium]|nr:serine/threonine protein kinase [Myxococcales bacterium]